MITQDDLNIFQSCRLRWKLSKEAHAPLVQPSPYYTAIKCTILQMYAWLQEKDKLLSELQIRDRWDKNWWTENNLEPTKENSAKAISGWLTIRNFWENFYLAEPYLTPIATNFEFSTYIHNVHFRVHADVILTTKNGEFTIRQFGIKKTHNQLFHSLSTYLELVGCIDTLGVSNVSKSYINISSDKPTEILLNPPKTFINQAQIYLADISRSIYNNVFYPSPTQGCSSCPFAGQCM